MQSRLSKDCPKLQSEHGDGREDHDRGSRGNRACRQLRSGQCSHPRHPCGPDSRGAVVRDAHRVSDDKIGRATELQSLMSISSADLCLKKHTFSSTFTLKILTHMPSFYFTTILEISFVIR